MTQRQRLPSRRRSENFTFELGGLRFTATISRLADGRIAELFLNNHKAGNQSDTNARDAAIILSFALLYSALFTYAAGELDSKVDFSYYRTARPSESTRNVAASASEPERSAHRRGARSTCHKRLRADSKESAPQANLQRRQHAQRKLTERDDAAGRDAACPRKSMANPNASRHRRE